MIFSEDQEVQGRLILVRHGQCEGSGRFLGRGSDVALDATGLSQKEALRCWFQELPETDLPGRIFTSHLCRARETAEALTGSGLVPELLPSLSEIDLGDWEGLTYAAIMETWPQEGRAWFSDPYNSAPPGGESGRAFQSRISDVFHQLTSHLQGGASILAVTHAGVIRTCLTLVLDLAFDAQWRFAIEPGGRTTIHFQAGFPVVEGINQ